MDAEERREKIIAAIGEVDALLGNAVKHETLEDVPDEALGQLFASVLRLYAAKVASGDLSRAFPRGSGITATDVMIGCTAILQAVDVSLFSFSHWQSMTTIGKAPLEDIEDEASS